MEQNARPEKCQQLFTPEPGIANQASPVWLVLVCAAAVVGLTLLLDSIRWTSATYDEVAYLRVAARWWRTRRADRDHSHGLAPHILEVAASACALDARPAG